MQNISPSAMKLLKVLEGKRLTRYKCKAGVWTIGYGHVMSPGDKHKITTFEAARLLKEDLARFIDHVWQACEDGARIPTQHQFDAMVIFAFNIGCAGFTRSSVLRRFLNQDDSGAAAAFLLWDKIGYKDEQTGERVLRPSRTLQARRTAESRLFLFGYYDETPYNSLDDQGELAELNQTRNRAEGDSPSDDTGAVSAGDSERRPTLKDSRTMKAAKVGSGSAVVASVATGAGALKVAVDSTKAVADAVGEAAGSAGAAVDTATGVIEGAGELAETTGQTAQILAAVPYIAHGLAFVAAVVAICCFVAVRRARIDDWNRGKR